MKTIATVAIVLGVLTWCDAGNEVVQYANVRDVQSLSGAVTDPSGAPITGARVCEMSGGWKTDVQCTTTDSEGHWSLEPTAKMRIYEIKFAVDGFNQVWIRLRIKTKAKPFTIELPIAT